MLNILVCVCACLCVACKGKCVTVINGHWSCWVLCHEAQRTRMIYPWVSKRASVQIHCLCFQFPWNSRQPATCTTAGRKQLVAYYFMATVGLAWVMLFGGCTITGGCSNRRPGNHSQKAGQSQWTKNCHQASLAAFNHPLMHQEAIWTMKIHQLSMVKHWAAIDTAGGVSFQQPTLSCWLMITGTTRHHKAIHWRQSQNPPQNTTSQKQSAPGLFHVQTHLGTYAITYQEGYCDLADSDPEWATSCITSCITKLTFHHFYTPDKPCCLGVAEPSCTAYLAFATWLNTAHQSWVVCFFLQGPYLTTWAVSEVANHCPARSARGASASFWAASS